MTTTLAVTALLVALVALAYARHVARQLAQLTEMYWALKYAHGELKAAVAPSPPPAPAAPTTAFVPLGSVKRSGG